MSFVIAGRSGTFLMTNGEFGNLWSPKDVKKIKVINKHSDGWEIAEKKGGKLMSWHFWLDEIAKNRHERNERQKQHEKELEQTAFWQEYPDGLVWKATTAAKDLDLIAFETFKPKRRLVSRHGWIMKIEGETDQAPCFYCYNQDYEIEAIERAYKVVEGGEA